MNWGYIHFYKEIKVKRLSNNKTKLTLCFNWIIANFFLKHYYKPIISAFFTAAISHRGAHDNVVKMKPLMVEGREGQ